MIDNIILGILAAIAGFFIGKLSKANPKKEKPKKLVYKKGYNDFCISCGCGYDSCSCTTISNGYLENKNTIETLNMIEESLREKSHF